MSRWLFFSVVLLSMAASCGAGPITRRSFRTSDGVNLSYLEAGREYAGKKKLAIALVSGLVYARGDLAAAGRSIRSNYHTHALDPRGQGESDVPAAGYTAERRATDIGEFLQPLSMNLSASMP